MPKAWRSVTLNLQTRTALCVPLRGTQTTTPYCQILMIGQVLASVLSNRSTKTHPQSGQCHGGPPSLSFIVHPNFFFTETVADANISLCQNSCTGSVRTVRTGDQRQTVEGATASLHKLILCFNVNQRATWWWKGAVCDTQ